MVALLLTACSAPSSPIPPDDGGKRFSGPPQLTLLLEDNAPIPQLPSDAGWHLSLDLQSRSVSPEGALLAFRFLDVEALAPLMDGGALPVSLLPLDELTCEARGVPVPVDTPERVQDRSVWLDLRLSDGEGHIAATRQRIFVTGGPLDGGVADASDAGGT